MPSPSKHTPAHQTDKERSQARESADSRAQERMRKPLPTGSSAERGVQREPGQRRSGGRGEASALAGDSGLGRMVHPDAQDKVDTDEDSLDDDTQ